MKVKDLIKKLQNLDQELEIFFENNDDYYGKSNTNVSDITEEYIDSFELFNENEEKQYNTLQRELSMRYTTEFKDKEIMMHEKINQINNDIMLSEYAKRIEIDKIHKDEYYASITKDKNKYNKIITQFNILREKIIKKKIIVLI